MDDFDHHALFDERTRIELKFARDEQADAVELVSWNRRRLTIERHDVDDAGALQHRERIIGVEAREAVPGKQRPVDLLLAVLPAAPLRNGRQERVNALRLELLTDDLFVSRARPDRKPALQQRVSRAPPGCPASSSR